MNYPEAVRKHDGRVVAYDGGKVAGSIARAVLSSDATVPPDGAKRLGAEISRAAGSFLAAEGQPVSATADIRALVVRLLRETHHEDAAHAYAEHARAATSLLWSIRVVEPGTPFTSIAGAPWDRRRLLESLRASGIARDPAGDAAREIERRVAALGQERISPALIHALACMVLAQRALDLRSYAARRVAFSMPAQTPRYDVLAAEHHPLPPQGPALEAFWMQAVHSHSVARAVAENILSLDPFPSEPMDDTASPCQAAALDPLSAEAALKWAETRCRAGIVPVLRADGPNRAAACGHWLARISASDRRALEQGVQVCLQPVPEKRARSLRRASPVTINIAGLLVREALRDQVRASVRLAQAVSTAAQAHREREEYFNFSPVRGRQLPIAVVGLWNAVAWLQGHDFDAPPLTRPACGTAGALVSVLRGATDSVRQQTGMELLLAGIAPERAARTFWRNDREFFLRDGITLDAHARYDGGPSARVPLRREELGVRLDFVRDVGSAFDEPPAVFADAALGNESDAELWRDVLLALAGAGAVCVRLVPGGTGRGMRALVRLLRSETGAYPLFEQLEDENTEALFGQR